MGTFRSVLKGKVIGSLADLETVCNPPGDFMKTQRGIAMIPFLARMDPWLEYIGLMRDE